MSSRFVFFALLAGVCVALSVSTVVINAARDDGDEILVRLIGFEENPSISTTGRGRLTVRIHEDNETIDYRLRYSDLEGVLVPGGVVLFAHIHLGAQRTNGGIVAFLCGGGGKPACPTPTGDVTGTIRAADIVGPVAQGIDPGEPTAFAEFVKAIRAGFTYGNVHTTRWPTGEIRGQLHNHEDEDEQD